MTDFLANLDPFALYPALFVGLILLGGIVLLPALFLALVGTINLLYLFPITVLAGLCSDSFWYAIGLSAKKERIYSWGFIRKRIEQAREFSSFYEKHGVRLVFLTKFVYGTRIASHVLAGMHRLHLPQFLFATGAGTAIWFWILYALIRILDVGIASAGEIAFRLQIIFLVSVILLVLFNWYTAKYVRKSFFKSRKKKG